MKRGLTLIASMLMMFGLFSSHSAIVKAQTTQRYAYALQTQTGDVIIKTIDTSNPSNAIDLLTMTPPPGFTLSEAYVSPNHKWIALILGLGSESLIRVVSVDTLTSYDIGELVLEPYSSSSVSDRHRILIWSPDSSKIAFNVSSGGDQRDTYIYNLATNNHFNLTNDIPRQYQYAWSNDSTRLAIFTNLDRSSIEIFDVDNGVHLSSIDVSAIVGTGYANENTLCRLSWSPNAEYLSFVSTCDTTLPNYYKEVYILSLSNSVIAPATSFTSQVGTANPAAPLYANYETIWYDDNSLLIGIEFRNPTAEGVQTLMHEVSNGNDILINTGMAQEWALNPISNDLAFRNVTVPVDRSYQTSSVQVAALDTNGLNLHANLVSGCNLSWSPNGAILAYTEHALQSYVERCKSPIQKIIFFDRLGGGTIEQSLPSTEYIVNIGWVVIEPETNCKIEVIANDTLGLVNAITSANSSGQPTTICLAEGSTYTFTAIHNNDNGLPRISGDITIEGNGATLTRSGTAQFRFFEVLAGGKLTLKNLTLSNGNAGDEPGGAIFNFGEVTLSNTTFSGNTAYTGGAIDNQAGTVTITDSRFLNNTATQNAGVIYNSGVATASAHNTCFSGNSTTAVYNYNTTAQDFTHNWWGAVNGPSGAGPGSGDSVSSKVNFTPFLTTGCPQ